MAAAELPSTLVFATANTAVYERVSSVCIGTGRFLRAVLVPALSELGGEIVLAQTRGTSFGTYMQGRIDSAYEVDTVQPDGQVETTTHRVVLAGSLGVPEGRLAFMGLPARLPNLVYVGLGLTEAGIRHNGQSIIDLAEFLHGCFLAGLGAARPLSVINTDNVPFNGDAIRKHVLGCDFASSIPDAEGFARWLEKGVVFHNSMVDRITAHRAGVPEVPRAEPLPAKALVLEDLKGVLPPGVTQVPGVAVRTQPGQLVMDMAMKLRVANGLHTAMVYTMALGRLFKTDECIGHPDILPYLRQLYTRDIVNMCGEFQIPSSQLDPVFSEWMARLQHPHFGLDCLFVCQNAIQKLGIRLLPSVKATLSAGKTPSDFMVFALAAILRFLTPMGEQPRSEEKPPTFLGRLDCGNQPNQPNQPNQQAKAGNGDLESCEYTPGLRVHPHEGTYEFRDGDGTVPLLLAPLAQGNGCCKAAAVTTTVAVLARVEGFDAIPKPEQATLADAVGGLLHRLLSGERALSMLSGLLLACKE